MPEGPVYLLFDDGTRALLHVDPDAQGTYGTHRGTLSLAEVLKAETGSVLTTNIGARVRVLRPSLEDLLMRVRRKTQIVYPKDAGFTLLKLGLRPGDRVFETGSGSGAMTIALAWAVSPSGRVVTYEREEAFLRLARENVTRAGFADVVEFVHADASQAIAGGPYDAAFIDVREPWSVLAPLREALRPGALVAFLLPTTNQVQKLLQSLQMGFTDVEVLEILHRYYKPNPARLRPEDRMTGHTGYLVFARREVEGWEEEGKPPVEKGAEA